LLIEAGVGGGIPIIENRLKQCWVGNRLRR